MESEFEFTAEVSEYVEPFADPVEDAADAFVVAESEHVAAEIEIVGFVDVASDEPVAAPFLMADLPAFSTEAEFVDFTRYRGVPVDAPQWWDGYTEVPEGYLWPWQVAEMQAQAEHDAYQFSDVMYSILGIEVPEFALVA